MRVKRGGHLRMSGVGAERVVPCRGIARNGAIQATVKNWKSHSDKVIGAKYTGRWTRHYNVLGTYVAKSRPALIYVRRDI